MNVKKILINSLWFGIIPRLTTLVNILILPLITPFLSPYDYGIWGVVSAYVSFGLAFCTLGLHMHLTNSYYEYQHRFHIFWCHIFGVLVYINVIVAVIVFGVLMCMLTQIPWTLRLGISALGVCPLLFNSVYIVTSHLYPLRALPRPLVLRQVGASCAGLLILFVTVYFFRWGYIGLLINAAVASIMLFVLFLHPLFFQEHIFPVKETNLRRVKEWLRISWPVIPHSLGGILLTSFSRAIMPWMGIAMVEIGLFSNAFLIGSYVGIVTGAIALALAPQIQESYRAKDFRTFRNYYFLAQGIAFATGFGINIWLPEFYSIMIRNPELQPCVPLAQIIVFTGVVQPLYLFLSAICFIEKRTIQLLWLCFLPGAVNMLLCLLFLRKFGYETAAYALLIAYLVQVLIPVLIRYFREKSRIWMGNLFFFPLLVVVLIGGLVLSRYLSLCPLIPKMIISCCCGILILGGLLFRRKLHRRSI